MPLVRLNSPPPPPGLFFLYLIYALGLRFRLTQWFRWKTKIKRHLKFEKLLVPYGNHEGMKIKYHLPKFSLTGVRQVKGNV